MLCRQWVKGPPDLTTRPDMQPCVFVCSEKHIRTLSNAGEEKTGTARGTGRQGDYLQLQPVGSFTRSPLRRTTHEKRLAFPFCFNFLDCFFIYHPHCKATFPIYPRIGGFV
jgi:hypothetical protein